MFMFTFYDVLAVSVLGLELFALIPCSSILAYQIESRIKLKPPTFAGVESAMKVFQSGPKRVTLY